MHLIILVFHKGLKYLEDDQQMQPTYDTVRLKSNARSPRRLLSAPQHPAQLIFTYANLEM